MVKKIFNGLFLIFLIKGFAQKPYVSIMQEQSNFYKQFNLNAEKSFDSLNQAQHTILNTAKTQNISTSICSLNKRVFGWHPYWNGTTYLNYQWNLLSDLCYFDYTVSSSTGNNTNGSFAWSTASVVTVAKANGVKVHICASLFSGFSTFWASSSAQTTFINNIINLLNTRGGNGVNIDFEGMGSSDSAPFTTFITNLSTSLKAANPSYELSICLYAVDWGSVFNMPALNSKVDFYTIMGYDYYYGGSAQAGPTSPLYNFQTSYNYTISKSITDYVKKGAPASKLLMGLPYYGREWEVAANTIPANTTGNFNASRTFNYIASNPSTYSSANKFWEGNCYSPYYAYLNAGNWRQCFIDDAYSLGRKYDMVNQRGLGGIGIWALGYDDGISAYWSLIQNKFSSCAPIMCNDSLFDMGGPTRNYYDNENYWFTTTAGVGNNIQLQFKSFSTEKNYDSLWLYDGVNPLAPLIGVYSGTVSPGTVVSTGSVLTLKFKSDGATNYPGWRIIKSCLTATTSVDTISPTTIITPTTTYFYKDFTCNYVDVDNTGGSGIEKSYYAVLKNTGSEFRSNNLNGYFYDDFNTLNTDWTVSVGTWSVTGNQLIQSANSVTNSNIYTYVNQTLSNRSVYSFNAKFTSIATNQRLGFHYFCDSASLSNRGNSYFIWVRQNTNTIELYKVIGNSFSSPVTTFSNVVIANNVSYNYKIIFDRISGLTLIYVNNKLIGTYTDSSPLTVGKYVSFRNANSTIAIDSFRVLRSRPILSNTISVGVLTAKDINVCNINPATPGAKIISFTNDNAHNISAFSQNTFNIDFTRPTTILNLNNGLTGSVNTTTSTSILSANWSNSTDPNSGVNSYWYCIGTSPGDSNIVSYTSVGLSQTVTASGLSLTNGQNYYFSVKSLNNANLFSLPTIGQALLVNAFVTGINETQLNASIALYPNPTNATLMINTASNAHVTICSSDGKIMLSQKTNHTQTSINTSLWENGIYFVEIQTNDSNILRTKFVKLSE
ncbi:MAG: T9SS type A sorting domain-containing protein [Bacteroidetes bacterium]|nr:T9SS type A sorting domain-containing protein [Bacteroidota bacterium]